VQVVVLDRRRQAVRLELLAELAVARREGAQPGDLVRLDPVVVLEERSYAAATTGSRTSGRPSASSSSTCAAASRWSSP